MSKAEFDFGTIFYILIAVVAAITSIIQKKNKKSEPTHEPHPHEVPKRTWEDVLTETFDIPEDKPKPQPSPVTVPTKPITKPVIEYSFVKSESNREMISNEGIEQGYDDIDIKAGEIGSSTESVTGAKFEIDLRRAIIYSEVINRKY